MSDNDQRIARGTSVAAAYRNRGEDERTVLVDILADLLHYADHVGVDFHDALDSAVIHFYAGYYGE